MILRSVLLWTAFVLAAAGCGDRDSASEAGNGRPVAVPFRLASSGVTAFGEIPWPSDLYLGDNGRVAAIPGLDRLATRPGSILQGLAALDGFGRSTGALFFLDAEIDSGSLPRTWDDASATAASVWIADVDRQSAHFGTRYPAYAKFLPSLGCLSVIPVPGIVLRPGTRHAVVITKQVTTTDGGYLVADSILSNIMAKPPQQRQSKPDHLYGDAIDALVERELIPDRGHVASLAVFTTSRLVFELPALRAKLDPQPEPQLRLDDSVTSPYTSAVFGIATSPSLNDWLGNPVRDEHGLEWPGGDNPGGIAHDQIGAIASGAFVAPSFLDRSTHHFEESTDGGTEVADANAIVPVTLMIPRRPPPPSGYPVVIHGHGLSNHRGSMLGVLNEFARAGFAVAGIDDVQHGSRQGIRDLTNNFAGPYDGPDGIPDGVGLPIAFFAGFSDFLAMRDNFRQTVLDQSSLVRLLQNRDLDLTPLARAAGLPDAHFDASRLYWSGGSLGGIIGAMTVAVEPEIRAAAFQVPGASFIQLITTGSPELAPLVSALANAALGVQGQEVTDEFHPVANLLAAVTEAGDPIAYAPHMMSDPLLPDRAPPDVLISYAAYDEVLPNIATHALVRAIGIELADPKLFRLPGIDTVSGPIRGNLANRRTGAAVQYLPANHGLGYARYDLRRFPSGVPFASGERFPHLPEPIRFEQPLREHLAQLLHFFETAANEGLAEIDVTVPPRQDYDGDGVTDDKERKRGTDPFDPASR